MASWRPMKAEPDAIRAALHDYIRSRAAKIFLEEGAATRPLGRADIVMSTGQLLRIELQITPADIRKVARRDAIVFEITGNAADHTTGYEVRGRVILDRKTLAFLAIDTEPTVINMRR